MLLGDAVHEALEKVGITDSAVARWVGSCRGNCEERRRRLNQLDAWARRVISGKVSSARKYLDQLLNG